jgi:malate dehydrogenase (oxaloacetate-decarboxylating)
MGLPIAKLAVYSAAGGIHPAQTLPVSLDFGTDNRTLLDDDLYLGWRHERLRGEEYDSLVEEFVHAVARRFPKAILQWEDFKKENTFRLLGRYRRTLRSFSDDVQGTAASALAGVLAAGRTTNVPLVDQRFVIVGAGVAGIGIARLLRDSLRRSGLSLGEALRRVAVLDSRGLIVEDRGLREPHKRELAWPVELVERVGLPPGERDLASVVAAVRPTVLVGASGRAGLFTEPIVRSLAARGARPLILLLSQPAKRSEASPAEVLAWTQGRGLVAIATTAFVFPAIGLGSIVAEAREITDGMFVAAAERLASEVSREDLDAGRVYPRIRDLRRVTARVAEAVVAEARDAGVGRPIADAAIPAAVAAAVWEPQYPDLIPTARTGDAA